MNPNLHLMRLRALVRAALALGVAASISANVLHAQHNAVGRAIAAWSPLALLLTVELISRVPVTGRGLSRIRMSATAAIAGIAAWVSYWHMVSVATRYGEATTSAHLLPLSVDGLVIVASVSLVEIAAKFRATQPASTAITVPVPALSEAGDVIPAAEPAPAAAASDDGGGDTTALADPAAPVKRRPSGKASTANTARTVTRLRERYPAWTAAQIAAKAGVTERTVRRHLNAAADEPAGPPLAAVPALTVAASREPAMAGGTR